jgi:Kelch motif
MIQSIVEVYDRFSNSWSTAAPIPTARFGLAVTALNGKIYAIGGSGVTFFTTVEVYDLTVNTWSTGAPLLTAKYPAADAGSVYALGGQSGNGQSREVEEYSAVSLYVFVKK